MKNLILIVDVIVTLILFGSPTKVYDVIIILLSKWLFSLLIEFLCSEKDLTTVDISIEFYSLNITKLLTNQHSKPKIQSFITVKMFHILSTKILFKEIYFLQN